MVVPMEVPLIAAVVLAAFNLALCAYLEKRHRRKIRLGLVEEHRYAPRQLEQFRRMRERMIAKERSERKKRAEAARTLP